MENKKCTKVYFIDEKFALEYIKKLTKTSHRERKPVRAYLCEKCLCWHLTSIELKESKESKQLIYLGRQIKNLKVKILTLKNENEILRSQTYWNKDSLVQ